MSEKLHFDERVAIVTGAGRGIGRAHALLLGARGARVVVNDLGSATVDGTGAATREPALDVVGEIERSGGVAAASFDDVSTESGAANLIAQALDDWGRLDILVNNAGINASPPFGEGSTEAFDRMMRQHAYGHFFVTRAAWPHMTSAGYGRVVLTTSGAALYGLPQSSHYCTAKGAIIGMTKALALEGAGAGIRVNAVAPAAYTRMVTGLQDESLRQQMEELMPPRFVAPMVAWLAHEACPVSGEIFDVGAGRAARVFFAESPGFCSRSLSIEEVQASFDTICDESGYLVFKTGMESAEKMAEMAAAAMS
ncbi:MAG: SDR family NAD(P)-dependent oxidoreductase [Gammaproteobacteria bacterium]|nr:SDR family NAD(P)-dependent oxidoreductase [Gammaproteobacteria bacterium]MDE0366764.1 SDR family NAD(P)-dependent oxidoreductase [Gammaproteobacteria bacterium]